MTEATEKKTDSREYLREIVRSNGALGRFWRKDRQLGAQVKSPTEGQVMINTDPLAFGGRGCISSIRNPVHAGPPFGWRPITFAEYAKRLRSNPLEKLRIFGRRSAYELKFFFLPWDEAPPKKIFDQSLLVMAPYAETAAFELSRRTREYLESLMVDGQPTLAQSLRARSSAEDNMFGLDMLVLYDLVGEIAIFKALFGGLLLKGQFLPHDQLAGHIKSEVNSLADMLEKRQLDMFLTDLTSRVLDTYLISLDRLYSKSDVFSALTAPQMKGYVQEVYYELQELRTMSENICAASVFLGHPLDLSRWIAELRNHDYALREILERAYKTDWDSYTITEDRAIFFRDRFAYPPEIAWWMWFSLEKETDQALRKVFAFDPIEVRRRTGLKVATEKELPTMMPAEALVGKEVELLVIRSDKFYPIFGLHLPALKVDSVLSAKPEEGAYFLARPIEGADPIVVKIDDELTYHVTGVRFGNSLPRSAPQIVTDAATSRLMRSNPYRRIIVEVSIDTEPDAQVDPSYPQQGKAETSEDEGEGEELTLPTANALLASYIPGEPSAFEILNYKILERYLKEIKAEHEARDIDYAR